MIKAIKNFFDASDFDEIGDSMDLWWNTIQNSFDFDAISDKFEFTARVISPPVPISANSDEMKAFIAGTGTESSFVDTLPKFTFRARMTEADCHHIFWPDPCDPRFVEDAGGQEAAIDWISKHIKVIALNATSVPGLGDTVKIKLDKQGIYTRSPESAILVGSVTTLNSISDEEIRRALEGSECATALGKIFDSDFLGESLDVNPLTATYTGGGASTPVENGLLEEAGVVLQKPSKPGTLYECTDKTTGGRVLFIPEAIDSFEKLAKAYKDHFNEPISINRSYRTLDEQIALKDRLGGGAATPGKSNHGWGVAFDVNGTLFVDGKPLDKSDPATKDRRFDSEVYKWLFKNAPGFGWVNPPGLQRGKRNAEAWHWENIDIRRGSFTNIKNPPPDDGSADGEEEGPD